MRASHFASAVVLIALLLWPCAAADAQVPPATDYCREMRELGSQANCESPAADAQVPPAAPIVVPITELALAPEKYIGRPIEVRDLICYYAKLDDYRCISLRARPVAVIFPVNITGPDAKAAIEQNCDQYEKATRSPRCRVTLRFTILGDDEINEDLVSGYQRRVIISPADAEAILPQPRGRRR